MKACVVVLGDVGRSPRMNFHALSLAKHGCNVTVIGYKASKMHPLLANNSLIQSRGIAPPPDMVKYLPRAVGLTMKMIWLCLVLTFALVFMVGLPNVIILQNPPGIPSMAICWIVAKIKRCRLVIDWHNYTYSILNMELSQGLKEQHKAVKFAEKWEQFWGPKADLSLCVTHAMRDDLYKRWGVRAVTLYDRPPQGIFAALTTEQKHRFFMKLAADKMYEPFWSLKSSEDLDLRENPEVTRFSYRDRNGAAHFSFANETMITDTSMCTKSCIQLPLYYKLRLAMLSWSVPRTVLILLVVIYCQCDCAPSPEWNISVANCQLLCYSYNGTWIKDALVCRQNQTTNRPLLLVSSTSWTADEDFSILLTALQKYDSIAKEFDNSDAKRSYPHIVAVITGKGPMKEFYLEEIERMKFRKVEIITPWLEPEDYPKILACADLGISLHTSSSGVDLPMKVVDMFGCSLPVLAKRFFCIEELVKEGEFGYLFDNALELCDWLMRMCQGFPLHSTDLKELKQNLVDSPLVSWEDNWNSTVWPLLHNRL